MKNWIVVVIALVGVFVSWFFLCYFYYKKVISEKAMEGIVSLEDMNLPGEEKMKRLVETLYDYLPPIVSKFFSKELLRQIAQTLFDFMKSFAIKTAKNKKNDLK